MVTEVYDNIFKFNLVGTPRGPVDVRVISPGNNHPTLGYDGVDGGPRPLTSGPVGTSPPDFRTSASDSLVRPLGGPTRTCRSPIIDRVGGWREWSLKSVGWRK